MKFIIIVIPLIILVIATAAFAEEKDNFLSADHIVYDSNKKFINGFGNVTILSERYIITADNITYDVDNDEIWASGNVRVKTDDSWPDNKKFQMDGDKVYFKNKMKEGLIKHFVLYFGDNSIIASNEAIRIDENHSKLIKSKYTACKICKNRNPVWEISAGKTEIDLEKEMVVYKNAFFQVYGLPIFFTPYFSHPTPKAKPQSGFLIPNKNKAGFGLPLYYRPKDNLDATITPRINNKGILYETEVRYITEKGKYNIETSYTNSKFKKKLSNQKIKTNHLDRYFVNAEGKVIEKGYNYGFEFNKTSDKAYLKEYYDRNDTYLRSNVYAESVSKKDFTTGELMMFDGLRVEDTNSTNPMVFPDIRIKQTRPVINENTYFTLENNAIHYAEGTNYNISRNSLSLSLYNINKTDNGHILKFVAYNRFDLYNSDITTTPEQNKILIRDIPEFHFDWKYPLMREYKSYSTMLEPEVLLVLGRGDFKKNIKYDYIDISHYSLSEENLFNNNRYSGVDFHEQGTRVSYGMKLEHNRNSNITVRGFLGKLDYMKHKDKSSKNTNFIAKSSINYDNMIEVYYNTQINSRSFRRNREDIGAWYNNQIIFANVGLVHVNPFEYYSYRYHNLLLSEGMRQFYTSLSYNINKEWSMGLDSRFDIRSKRKFSAISRNIKVTYRGDCVNIVLRFGKNYTTDPTRGIYKRNTTEVSLGLKTLDF